MRNRCYGSLSVTGKHLLPSDSRGGSFLSNWYWVSHRKTGGSRVVLFQLWLCSSASRTRIVCGYELSLRRNPLKRLCAMPLKKKKKKNPLEMNHMARRTWSSSFVFLHGSIRLHVTLLWVAACLFVYLKLLRLAPNLCWQYTMCYSYSCWCTQKNNTQATKRRKKNPIGTKWLFFFPPKHFQWTFLFYIHNNTQMHKAN